MLNKKDTLDAPQLTSPLDSLSSLCFSLVKYFFEIQNQKQAVVFVTPDDHTTGIVARELQFYSRVYLKDDSLKIFAHEDSDASFLRKNSSPMERWQRLQLVSEFYREPTGNRVIVCSLTGLTGCAISPTDFLSNSISLAKNQILPPHTLEQQLIKAGYERVATVEDRGTFSIRGGILDIFDPTQILPLRVEYFDDKIESLRFFDIESQRSGDFGDDGLQIFPAREFSCSPEDLIKVRAKIKSAFDEQNIPKIKRDHLSELLAKGIAPLELDQFLPIFQSQPSFTLSHLPKSHRIIFLYRNSAVKNLKAAQEALNILATSKRQKSEFALDGKTIINDPPDENTLPVLALNQASESQKIVQITHSSDSWSEWLKKFGAWIDLGYKIYVCASTQTQADRIAFLLTQKNLSKSVHFIIGSIVESQIIENERLVFISDETIFGKKIHLPRRQAPATKSKSKAETVDISLSSLRKGDHVVHIEHGIGIFQGLVTLAKPNQTNEDFVQIEFADKDKLYLPVYRLDQLQRYICGEDAHPKLDKLGGIHFKKAKERARESAKVLAIDLLKLYARRKQSQGFKFSEPSEDYHKFSAEFPYDETPDQEKAIEAVIHDMCSSTPMDRLVCGDVGFGKTEVALRAAFKACSDHKQVAILVPTTVLCEQHFQTFTNRFKNFPYRIQSISRFRSKREQIQTLTELADHRLDVIIGTHRLLSKDVKFSDLGLIIVDEEQRFGVEHKEILKEMRVNTDVLTLSATPIPRTLYMSLSGIRDISLIQTPPAERQPIKTVICEFDEEIIKEAIRFEMQRGGQIFFLHNRVQTIQEIETKLRELVPDARIVVGHGQMNSTTLEKAMLGFFRREYDILLATTIIENGLDIPNANTIIINRADTFGLSQLYQLRGRVGRSQVRAFAYLLTPNQSAMSDDALSRLRILQRYSQLGSGYTIASYDLEMRGGGELLGAEQSGHAALLGYDLFFEMIHEEVQRLRGEEVSDKFEVEINSPFSALLPEAYVGDMKTRLGFYKKLSSLSSEEQFEDAENELVDRFGPIPNAAVELFALLRLKVFLKKWKVKSILINRDRISLSAGPDTLLSLDQIDSVVLNDPGQYKVSPEGKLTLYGNFSSNVSVLETIRQVIKS